MPPRAIFVDTGAWYALQVTDDRLHPAAVTAFPKILAEFETLVTSTHVLAETYTLLRRRRGFREGWRFLDALERSPRVQVHTASPALEREAWVLLRQRPDQPLSFADAVSLCLMRQLGIQHAFAFAPCFTVEGFLLIPADPTS